MANTARARNVGSSSNKLTGIQRCRSRLVKDDIRGFDDDFNRTNFPNILLSSLKGHGREGLDVSVTVELLYFQMIPRACLLL